MNPFTRLQDSSYSTGLFLANKTGVLSSSDQTNVSLHVTGDASIDGKLHLNELLANEYTEVSDIRKKKMFKISNYSKALMLYQNWNQFHSIIKTIINTTMGTQHKK